VQQGSPAVALPVDNLLSQLISHQVGIIPAQCLQSPADAFYGISVPLPEHGLHKCQKRPCLIRQLCRPL
jgi:hypothetical protein